MNTARGKVFLVVLFLVLSLSACGGKNAAASMHLVKTEGKVQVDNEEGKPVKVAENLGLYSGYEVVTQKESYGWITLDDTKLAKMDETSEVEIRKKKKQLELYVQSGSLFFNVTEPLGEDETMDIRTSTMAVGIRGTCGWVEVEDRSLMCVYLLRGKVECTVFDREGNVLSSETITAGQAAKMELDGDNAAITVAQFDTGRLPDFVEDAMENPEDWGVSVSEKEEGSTAGEAGEEGSFGNEEGSEGSNEDAVSSNEASSAVEGSGEVIDDIHVREEDGILYFYGTGSIYPWDYEGYTPVNVMVEEGITGIGDGAFKGRESLISITLPASLEEIGSQGFMATYNLTSVTLSDGLKRIGTEAFAGCDSLYDIILPDSVESIGEAAFSCPNLYSITLSNSLKEIGKGAFQDCGRLTTVILPDSLESIDDYVFMDCQYLSSVTWPNGLKSIGREAFLGCGFASIALPDGLENIGDRAFQGCYNLTSITLPASIESIGEYVFDDSSDLWITVKAPVSLQDTVDNWFHHYNYVERTNTTFEWY